MKLKHYTVFILSLFLFHELHAQMRAPEEWLNYESVMNVKNNQRFYDYDVYCIRSSAPANLFWPGDHARFTFQLVNNTDEFISVDAKIELIQYGAKGIPNDIWLPEMIKIADIQEIPVKIEISANGYTNIDIELDLPETFGGYAIVFDLGKHGRRVATSLVRTFKPNPLAIQYPKQALDDIGADFLSRIGVQAIRMGISYIPTTHRDYVSEMEKLDKKLKEYKDKNITVLLMFMEGPALIPLGNPRSFLDDKNIFLKTKQDYVWLPELDKRFSAVCKKYLYKKWLAERLCYWGSSCGTNPGKEFQFPAGSRICCVTAKYTLQWPTVFWKPEKREPMF